MGTGQSVYAATKAGSRFTSDGPGARFRQITVNAIAPGFITTDMTQSLTEASRKEFAERIPSAVRARRRSQTRAVPGVRRGGVRDRAVVGINGGMYM